MLYSSAGLLALIIHLIINHDVLFRTSRTELFPAHRFYRAFLVSVLCYYGADILWGILYERQLITLTFLDTELYFLTMGCSILFWTRYTVEYLQENNTFGKLLRLTGQILFHAHNLLLAANFVYPILFSFDSQGVYHAEIGRYVTLVLQILMFLMTSVYAVVISSRSQGTRKFRHRTIGISSAAMAGFCIAQALHPLLPLYAIGCMLASCVLHSFVLENEKQDYQNSLEEKLKESILNGNYYDLLTGLPGMTYFLERTEKRRADLLKKGGRPALLYLDLSGVKFFNHRYGFTAGDKLLQSFAGLLKQTFGEENCSRFGSDHFVVFTEQEGLEDTLWELFHTWKTLDTRDRPAIRAGIYLDDGSTDLSTACDCAKTARDSIRNTYVSDLRFYDHKMLETAERRQYIISHLDQAMEEGWIQVYYQPIIRAASGRVCDEEALARWIDPERGFLSPADFIPILEEANLIYKLDLHVIDLVLKKMHQLQSSGLYLVPQSVNLSRSDFDMTDMVDTISRKMDASGLPRHLLSIEITESIVGSDFEFIRREIDRFRAAGFPVWMDDFGSGYSSLDVLSNVTVDLIKLDMRFMQQFDSTDRSRIVLTELMKMAIGLGIDTICEGVERSDQMEFMRDIGCTKLQGYYYTKPLPVNQILERYEKGIQIGFENPQESAYFEAIGRINLHDLAVIAQEDEPDLHHYFNTIPMAVIEVHDGCLRFARTNQAYRNFMAQTFHIRTADYTETYSKPPEGHETPFFRALQKFCREGGRSIIDETLSDGTVIHFFMRKVAYNPVTDTSAAVVAVLAVSSEPYKTAAD